MKRVIIGFLIVLLVPLLVDGAVQKAFADDVTIRMLRRAIHPKSPNAIGLHGIHRATSILWLASIGGFIPT